MIPFKRLLLFAAFLLHEGMATSQVYHRSISISIPFVPGIVMIEGKPTLSYELHLASFAADSLLISNLQIADAADSTVLQTLNQAEIATRFTTAQPAILPPGSTAVLYLDIVLPKKTYTRLFHRFTLSSTANAQSFIVSGAALQPDTQPAVLLGAPLSGGPWAAVYDPSWKMGHRRVMYTVDGQARIPGRYAIDFIKLDSMGKLAAGNEDLIQNWYGYGAAVTAVADGTVLAVRNNFTESPTLSGHTSCPPEDATGNYIALDIGNNRTAFYEHLQPGSIRVKTGQPIKKGTVIAALGFTGQTTGPHLHFHVADRCSPLGAEGIPFVFEQFTLLGAYTNFSIFGTAPWDHRHTGTRLRERPAPQSVLLFPPH